MGESKGYHRADALVLRSGLAETRSQARRLILDGKITDGENTLTDPGRKLADTTKLSYIGPPPFVSRGGDKLEAFLQHYPLPLDGLCAMDVGASTGGFTDCLLRRGVASVLCLDVGRGQLHPRLQTDARVTNLEGINARTLPTDIGLFDLVVVDLSFISLRHVLPGIWKHVREAGHVIALVKPQFEVGREACDASRGVIRDPRLQAEAVEGIKNLVAVEMPGSTLIGECPCPLHGGDGNQEFLLGWRRETLAFPDY